MNRAHVSPLCFVLASTPLHAQPTPSIAGAWQGTLPSGAAGQGLTASAGLRLVFTIEKNPDGSLRGVITPIDRGGATPLTAVTVSAPDVTFASGNALAFHGTLSPDGLTITGALTENTQSFPLTLALAPPAALWRPANLPRPMAASADPAFDVATIKPSGPEQTTIDVYLTARPVIVRGVSASELIKIAYSVRGRQVIGGPSWMGHTPYDITGIPDAPGLPREDQGRTMLRKLLADRFHLVARIDQQEFPVLAMTLDPNAKARSIAPSDPALNAGGNILIRQEGDDMVYQYSGVTIHQFLDAMMNKYRDKQIVDETGLTDLYDITLRMPATAFQGPGGHGPEDERAGAFLAGAEKAGFRFTAKRAPIPVVIIDHIDPPTPN